MKKTLLIGSMLASVCFATAQNRTNTTQLGVQVSGIGTRMENTSSASNESPVKAFNFTDRLSWKAGVTSRIPIAGRFFLAPEFSILSKGGNLGERWEMSATEYVEIEGKARLTYLELPVSIGYTVPRKNGEFFFTVGPCVSKGIDGKISAVATASTEMTYENYRNATPSQVIVASEKRTIRVEFDGKTSVEAQDENMHYRPYDIGANAVAGYQLKNGWQIRANINYSMNDIAPDPGLTSKNWYYGLGIGYSRKLK